MRIFLKNSIKIASATGIRLQTPYASCGWGLRP